MQDDGRNMLSLIFNLIGTPTEAQLAKLKPETVATLSRFRKRYVVSLPMNVMTWPCLHHSCDEMWTVISLN